MLTSPRSRSRSTAGWLPQKFVQSSRTTILGFIAPLTVSGSPSSPAPGRAGRPRRWRHGRGSTIGGMPRRFGPLVTLLVLVAVTGCARPGGGGESASVGPTPVPEPPSVQDLPGRGVQVDGRGTTETEDIVPQYAGGLTIGIDVVTLSHAGRSSFIVTAVQGEQSELLASAIGAYRGQRPLVVEGPVSFHVTADGAWSLTVQPMSNGGMPTFSGSGDAVSAYFNPPAPTTWSVS